jgi:serine protease Do
VVAASLAAALAGGLAGCGSKRDRRRRPAADAPRDDAPLVFPDSGPRGAAPRAGVPDSFVELARAVDASVVTIRAGGGVPRELAAPTSLGSGVIVDRRGLVLTNRHVIAGASRIVVALADRRELPAQIVGSDGPTDLALLRIEAQDLAAAPLGDSDALQVGDWVVAIGNPFGLDHTVTSGIVSAKGRSMAEMQAGAQNDYQSFIQTDASINPGNSGGPLVSARGEVVGINTAIDSRGTGIGYAIPINMAKQILPMLERDGRVTRAYLGVYIAPVSAEGAEQLGLPGPGGALVVDVTRNGPAYEAGIRRGDVILSLGGTKVDDKSLPWVASTTGIGRELEVVVWRARKEEKLWLVPARMPD